MNNTMKKIGIAICIFVMLIIIGMMVRYAEPITEVSDNQENVENNVEENTKEDYEFETIKGYTTLQSLILSIDDNDNYKKIKNMADYRGYYIKDSTGAEANGIIKIIYNTGEKEYYNKATEYVMLYFGDFSGKKLWKIEYNVSNSSIKYTYYVSDHSKSNVSVYKEETKYYENKEDAFTYINQKVGYEG